MSIGGLHHVTAIASDPRKNVEFYTRVLGLRVVKHTVNFDDQATHHVYYGDKTGRPGTVLSFFVRPGGTPGRPGAGQITCVRFGIAPDSIGFWTERLAANGVAVLEENAEADESAVVSFCDPDGLVLQLVAASNHLSGDVSCLARETIRGLHSIELTVSALAPTCALLSDLIGLRPAASGPQRERFAAAGAGPGLYVDVRTDAAVGPGAIGVGSVHHAAFRVLDARQQRDWQQRLRRAGFDVTEVKDRRYFQSIYFSEPGGVRLELATDGPGFLVDERLHELGGRLQLPPSLEGARAALESSVGGPLTFSASESLNRSTEPASR